MGLTVSQIARTKIVSCIPDCTIQEVADKMLKDKVGSVLVKEKDGRFVGIISEESILELVSKGEDLNKLNARDVMGRLHMVGGNATIEDAIEKFDTNNTNRLAVTKAGKVVGVVKRKIAERFLSITYPADMTELI